MTAQFFSHDTVCRRKQTNELFSLVNFHFLLFVEVEKAKFSLFKTFDELNLPIFVSLPNVGRYQHPPFDSLRGFVFVALS